MSFKKLLNKGVFFQMMFFRPNQLGAYLSISSYNLINYSVTLNNSSTFWIPNSYSVSPNLV